jgi:hypothetical protein
MSLTTALQVIQGKSFRGKSVSICHAILGILAVLTTTLFRIVLLLIGLSTLGGNSTFVRLSPPEDISVDESCEIITVVESSETFTQWSRSKYEVRGFNFPSEDYSNYNREGSAYSKDTDQDDLEVPYQEYLVGHTYNWFSYKSKMGMTPLHSYDESGYYIYYFYCGDVSQYLNTTWIPVIAWFLVNILPHILLSILILIFTLKEKCPAVSCRNLVFLLSGIFSHIHVGPVSCSNNHSGNLRLSKIFSSLNILLTFIGMCIHLYLNTVAFGAGDSSATQQMMPISTCVPLFILSALFNAWFLCFCFCSVHTEPLIFSPSDPNQLFTLGTDGSVVLLKGSTEMTEK